VATPLSQRELDALSEEADRFIAELDEEAYLHFAGHKETYDLVPIYERHVELTKLDTALSVGASVNGGRNVRELWRFACEGYLGNFVSEEEEKIAEAETHTVKVGDEEILYRDLRPRIANEEDRASREIIERARNESTEEHNGLYIRKHQVVHRETERLGAPNYTELSQRNVELDLEDRPNKTPRAFCVPIEIPERVVLVIKPQGGPDDWRALFHEAGHTEHFAHTSASLTVEERRLGDNAVTEGWAMLLEHLTIEPAWLNRRLDLPRPLEFAAEGATQLLWILRRYCAKLIYELEFHTVADVTTMKPRYVELLSDALKVTPSDTDYLADIDDGFYASQYLRAWAFEAQLRSFLREKFGNEWFTRRDAGSLIRELWSEGQKPTADELLLDVTGARLELEAAAERVRESLAAV
jgi:hypothetical protein